MKTLVDSVSSDIDAVADDADADDADDADDNIMILYILYEKKLKQVVLKVEVAPLLLLQQQHGSLNIRNRVNEKLTS